MENQVNLKKVKLGEFIQLYFSSKHQSFYFNNSQDIPKEASLFWVCTKTQLQEFKKHIYWVFQMPKVFITIGFLNTQLQDFLCNQAKAKELLVEFEEIISQK